MNNNIIFVIIFSAIFILSVIYLLYSRAYSKKQAKMRRILEEKKQKNKKIIKYQPNQVSVPVETKENIKKRIIIKKPREDATDNDIISEAISELDDLSFIKQKIFSGQKNLTNISNIERDNTPFHILVVDDSPSFLKKAKSTLVNAKENYSITTACDGEDALYQIKKQPFDLIITDMDMPKMDGSELIIHLKNDLTLSNIPVIVVTADPKLITKGLEDKVEGVLEKPYNDEDLLYQAKISLS